MHPAHEHVGTVISWPTAKEGKTKSKFELDTASTSKLAKSDKPKSMKEARKPYCLPDILLSLSHLDCTNTFLSFYCTSLHNPLRLLRLWLVGSCYLHTLKLSRFRQRYRGQIQNHHRASPCGQGHHYGQIQRHLPCASPCGRTLPHPPRPERTLSWIRHHSQ